MFIDAILVEVRDAQVGNRPFYAAIGVTLDGEKDVLGVGRRRRGREVLDEGVDRPAQRGVKDVFFVCDGLKGLPEIVTNVWR